jgi:hypothetical protein
MRTGEVSQRVELSVEEKKNIVKCETFIDIIY